MVEQMRRHWWEFRERKPGQRFENRYRRRRQDEQEHIVWRIFSIAPGAVIAAARFLDWLEVQLRKLWRVVLKVWRASFLGKVVVAGSRAAAFVYVGYLLLSSGSLF